MRRWDIFDTPLNRELAPTDVVREVCCIILKVRKLDDMLLIKSQERVRRPNLMWAAVGDLKPPDGGIESSGSKKLKYELPAIDVLLLIKDNVDGCQRLAMLVDYVENQVVVLQAWFRSLWAWANHKLFQRCLIFWQMQF